MLKKQQKKNWQSCQIVTKKGEKSTSQWCRIPNNFTKGNVILEEQDQQMTLLSNILLQLLPVIANGNFDFKRIPESRIRVKGREARNFNCYAQNRQYIFPCSSSASISQKNVAGSGNLAAVEDHDTSPLWSRTAATQFLLRENPYNAALVLETQFSPCSASCARWQSEVCMNCGDFMSVYKNKY